MPSSRPPIRAFLIDLSGTLHIGHQPTPNAVEALERLRKSGIPLRFCSNTSKESTAVLYDRLTGMGFDIRKTPDSAEELWTSLGAVKRRLQDKNCKRYVLMCDVSLYLFMMAVCNRPLYLLSSSAREEIDPTSKEPSSGSDTPPYDSVVVGLAPSLLTYEHMNTAFRILTGEQLSLRPSCLSTEGRYTASTTLIATHKARYIRSADSALSLGPGPFVTALENASGVQAEVVGKPTRGFFETVIGSFGFGSNMFSERGDGGSGVGRVAVIGDDVEADLGEGAVELGLWRVLGKHCFYFGTNYFSGLERGISPAPYDPVKTGKFRPGDEKRQGLQPPEEVHDSFAAFVNDFLESIAVQK